jgi:monovalent cation/hydrogen antiporter
VPVESLLLVAGLLVGAVLLVGVGDRLRLPWPALMVLLGAAVAVTPGLPDSLEIDPELILPIFLPPLLYATAQRTSWSVFRARWRTLVFMAVALVLATTAAVAGAAYLLVPGIGLTAAVALGAMVAPPDPVAVEAVAGQVRMPRRILTVLQAEGLFNDATALVVFQAALLATVDSGELAPLALVVAFVGGAVGAVLLGYVVARLARLVMNHVADTIGRSALTLVLPFAVYLVAEEVHVSGVIAVVVLALELRSAAGADESAERLVQRSFWSVVEMLVTGLAFGLIGLELRAVVVAAGDEIGVMLVHAAIVCAVVFGVRAVWMVGALYTIRYGAPDDASAAPRTPREVVLLSWSGMRGLATLALALSIPSVVNGGGAFPARTEIVLVACVVLLATLLLPGFTLGLLVRMLGIDEEADAEDRAEAEIAKRARSAALRVLAEKRDQLPPEVAAAVGERFGRFEAMLRGESATEEDRERMAKVLKSREIINRVQAESLAAARAEVLAARKEPGVDPEAADRVLNRLDLRTVLLT